MNYFHLIAILLLIAGCASGTPPYAPTYSVDASKSNEDVLKANRDKTFIEQLNLGARKPVNLDAAPKLVRFVFPKPPTEAPNKNIAGQVEVRIAVDEDGNVTKVDIVKTAHNLLSEAVAAAAMQWKFSPATAGGVPTTFTVRQTYTFK